MSVWFDGESEIGCHIQLVKRSFEDHGEVFLDVVALMPGLTSVELVEQDEDSLAIKTNEGLMTRTNISKGIDAERVIVEFDEQYEAGSKVTTSSHFRHEFVSSGAGVTHHLVMSDVTATGVLGFFYRNLGSSKTGNAFLEAYRSHFEQPE